MRLSHIRHPYSIVEVTTSTKIINIHNSKISTKKEKEEIKPVKAPSETEKIPYYSSTMQ